MRQGCLQGLQSRNCSSVVINVRQSTCRGRRSVATYPGTRVPLRPAAAAAEATEPSSSAARGRPKGRTPRKKAPEEDVGEQGMPALPMPLDYQQTLVKSFTLGGVGLHSAEYAVVRVRPAYAEEGRYFVRVPKGTNAGSFNFADDSLLDEKPFEEFGEEVPVPEEIEDLKVEWFRSYLAAQEEDGFIGTFGDFLQQQVLSGAVEAKARQLMLGLPDDEADVLDIQPDFSMEPEDIIPLDPADPTLVKACISSVQEVNLPYTQLGSGDNRVMSVELLLAALEASGVDNARIEIEGGHEIPVLDNSALGWCIDIQCAGLRPAPVSPDSKQAQDVGGEEQLVVVQRNLLKPPRAIAVQDESGWISFFPGPFSKLTACADHSQVAPVIGTQWFTWHNDDVHFRYSLAPARGYVESVQELFTLRDAGYVQAGAENLFLIAVGDRWWDPSVVRMAHDEPVRYKLSQLVGNLSLCSIEGSQGIPVGHVTAYNASPALQLSFAKMMVDELDKEDFTSFGDVLAEQAQWYLMKYGGDAGDTSDPTDESRQQTSIGGDIEFEGEDDEDEEYEDEEYEDEEEEQE